VLRRGRSGCQPGRRVPARRSGALSDFGDASTATLLRGIVKDGQVARDLRTDLDAMRRCSLHSTRILARSTDGLPVAATCGSNSHPSLTPS
jgi:hypothetical protein